jgi:type IV secretion system protein VirB4
MDALTAIFIAMVVAVSLMYLLGGWRKLVGGAPRLLGLKPVQDRAQGLADLLQWAALVDSGIVQTKDGALLAGFFYSGRDVAASTDEERNSITQRVNAALARLGNGWVTWHDAVRMPAPAYSSRELSHFPDPITAAIDEERRRYFTSEGQHFESQYALTLMYTPPARHNTRALDFLYDDELTGSAPATQVLDKFRKALDELEDSLCDIFGLRRMQSFEVNDGHRNVLRDELVNYLNFTLTGSVTPVNIPDPPMYMDAYLGMEELWPGDTPRLGRQFIACVAITGFPSASYPNILAILDTLPIAYRWSTRMIYLDQHEALGALGTYRRKWQQRRVGFAAQIFKTKNAQVNQDAVEMAGEVDAAIADAHSGLVTYGYYTVTVVLMDESRKRLQELARSIAAEITRAGFTSRVETVNTVDAWLGSLPGHPRHNIRRPLLHTLNLADLLPLSSVWAGLSHNPCPFFPQPSPPWMHVVTTGATPFRLNLHHGDLGHTLILGPTGAGKSTLLATLAAQFRRYPGATITAFDKGNSLFTLVSATGDGMHYDLMGEGSSPGLCPLQYIDSEQDAAWAEDWLATCFELQANAPPTPRQREEIHRAMRLLRQSVEGRSLTDWIATVQDADLRSALANYTIDGPLGRLLDSRQDSLLDSPFVVFEVEEIMAMGERNALPVLLYLFRRFERSLRGQPAALVLDEAWLMLGHAVFRAKIREWLKDLRKKNCVTILATQSLSDLVASGILDVLIEGTPTKILLPNEEADKAGTGSVLGPRDLYTLFGCNDAEINILKSAQRKRDYYYVSAAGRRLINLGLGPLTLSFVAVSDKATLARVRQLIELYGPKWSIEWLNERGLAYETFLQTAA